VPVKAESAAKAKLMAVGVPTTWLLKLYYDIGNLTDDDTDQSASLASWRPELGNTKRLRKQVPRLRELYVASGKQPEDFSEKEQDEIFGDLKLPWFGNDRGTFGLIARVLVNLDRYCFSFSRIAAIAASHLCSTEPFVSTGLRLLVLSAIGLVEVFFAAYGSRPLLGPG
jgi:hypothetical protein